MRKTWIFLLVFITVQLKAQLDSLAHLQYDVRLNDIWGYQDDLGNEYIKPESQTDVAIKKGWFW